MTATFNSNALAPDTLLRSPNYTYRIDRVLGSGGFGITYLATAAVKVGNVTIKAKFAIKEHFVSSDCERDPATNRVVYSNPVSQRVENARKDFIAEANRLHKVGINHRNIVKVNEVFEGNNTAYYVMEFIEGESLRSYVRRRSHLDEKEAVSLMTPILDAVGCLHANKMTHLDIKPDNIMLSREDDGSLRPVLIDFGLSKHYDSSGRPTSTVNTLGCSDGYAPIEQYAGITTFSPTADYYALGCTLWFCLVGRDPKKSVDLADGELARQLPTAISPRVSQLIANATRLNRSDRSLPLQSSSRQEPLPPTPPPVMYGGPDTAPIVEDTIWSKTAHCLQKSWKPISIIAALIAIVVVAINWPHSDDDEQPATDILQSALQESNLMQQSGGQVKSFTVNGVSFNMVRVEGGTFQMGATSEQGSPNSYEKPVHSVTLSSYYIGETEVTQALWQAVMGKNPSKWKGDNLPVEQVSWDDCQEFIKKLNSLTNRNFRLPTEAEWEFAARGGTKSRGYQYSGSNTIGDVAWYDGNSDSKTHPVKTKAANELDLYDMSGNVWEWCADWKGSYSSGSQTNHTGPSSGSDRVHRGGGWDNYAGNCRVANRGYWSPDSRYDNLGLRLAL